MNRLSKVILITFACLLVLTLGAVVAVNLYVQSPGTQTRIKEEVSKALRVPIDITNASVTPWGGLRIAGITVPGEAGNFLEASSFNASYRLLPLLQGKLVISNMILDSPKIIWAQNKEGRWELPALPDTGEKKRARDEAAENSQPPPVKKKESGFTVKVEGFEIRNGSIELRDTDNHRVAQATDVQITYTFPRPDRIDGSVVIQRLAWKDALIFNDLHSPFSYTKGELQMPSLRASIGGGTVNGRVTLEPEKKDSPFDFDLHCEKVDVARVTAEAGWPAGQAAGTLSGSLNLHGSSKKAERAEGKGEVTLVDGQFRQFEFFQTLGQVLQIAELANLRLREGHAEFRVADEKTFFETLMLDAPDLRLTAKGLVRFDGKLVLDAELGVSQRLAKQLPGFVKENFGEANADGTRSIPFKITGRTDKPRTDLLDRLVGQKVGSQFDDLVSNLFGIKKKGDGKDSKEEKKKKKKDAPPEEPATAAAPEPVP